MILEAPRGKSLREIGCWLWIGAAVLLLLIGTALVLWAIVPTPERVVFDDINAITGERPVRLVVEMGDGEAIPVWLTRRDGDWIVLDGRSPRDKSCLLALTPENQFWDICSVWTLIWSADGRLLSFPSPPAPQIEPYLRDLDQFPALLRNSRLTVDVTTTISGTHRTEPSAEMTCRHFDDMRITWLRCELRE